jgi:hypothetical protein
MGYSKISTIIKSQITSTKLQINSKIQYSMTKTLGIGIYDNLKHETSDRFRILNFGHCDLFGICDLKFCICLPQEFIEQLGFCIFELITNLPIPLHYKFSRGKLFQSHRAEGVQFRGADADFSAQSQLAAIIKTRRSIYQNHG